MSARGGYHTFSRIVDGGVRIIAARDLDEGTLPDHPYVLTMILLFKGAENGFRTSKEADYMYKVEDLAAKALADVGAVHMGHFIEHGLAVLIYRSKRPGPSHIEVKTGLLKKERLAIETREDRDWIWYASEAAPTKREIQISHNVKLHGVLRQHGDVATMIRPVDFTFLFPTPEQRASAFAALEAEGYKLNAEGMWDGEDGSFWVSVVADTDVESDQMADRGMLLTDLAEAHGGEFDGWACPVVKG